MSAGKRTMGVLPEFLVAWVSSACLAMVCYHGFYIDDIGSTFLGPVLCGVFLAVLFWVGADRKRWLLGCIGYLVLAALAVAASMALSNAEAVVQADAEGNYLYFMLVTFACPTACYLLSRTLPGCVVWLAASAFLCALVQAMYVYNEYILSIAADAFALVLLLLRNAAKGREGVAQTSGSSPVTEAAMGVIAVAASLAVGLVVWFVVIAPLSPGTIDTKLITHYVRLPIDFVKGVADINPIYDTSLTSENLVEGERMRTDDLKVDDNAVDEIDARTLRQSSEKSEVQQDNGNQGMGTSAGNTGSIDNSSTDEVYDTQSYSDNFPWIIIWIILALLIIAAIVAFFLLRRRYRRRRLDWLLDAPPTEQVSGLYLFLLTRLHRIGFKMPAGQTLMEWARDSARSMDVICTETGVSFEECTRVYCECVAYGRHPADDITVLVAFYEGFWRGARAHLGSVRYFFTSFVL